MLIPLAILTIILGIGQILSSYWRLRAASLVGSHRTLGYALGLILIIVGSFGFVASDAELNILLFLWILLAIVVSLGILVLAGVFLWPPPHPDQFFTDAHPAHGGCEKIEIPDGELPIPVLLLQPLPGQQNGAAVCIVHGSGDSKHGFKWRLVQALLDEGLTVLTIDMPGHGEYLDRIWQYPDCLSVVPAALQFLRAQPDIKRVGVLGISLGAAVTLKSIATAQAGQPPLAEAIALMEMPISVKISRQLFFREGLAAVLAPIMSVLQDMNLKQAVQSWQAARIRSAHSTEDSFTLLNPLESIKQLDPAIPLLLVYSRRDPIALHRFGAQLQAAAPHATLIEDRAASHVTMILIPAINRQVAAWLRAALTP